MSVSKSREVYLPRKGISREGEAERTTNPQTRDGLAGGQEGRKLNQNPEPKFPKERSRRLSKRENGLGTSRAAPSQRQWGRARASKKYHLYYKSHKGKEISGGRGPPRVLESCRGKKTSKRERRGRCWKNLKKAERPGTVKGSGQTPRKEGAREGKHRGITCL